MAGRAGRRGKDVEGTVVIMRSKFEDAKMGHKILTSNIDGIRSHFKTSYGLTIKLLETKTLEECQALIERGFGSYLLQMRNQNKVLDEINLVDTYKTTLQTYTLQGAREYLKLKRRLEKERRSEEFQLEKISESDVDLVHAIADYMPLGIGLLLKNGMQGYFLGDVKWGNNNANSGYGVINSIADTVMIVNKNHIKSFADTDESIPVALAQEMLDLVEKVEIWDEEFVEGVKKPILKGKYNVRALGEDSKLSAAVEVVRRSRLSLQTKEPGSLVKQRMIIRELEEELAATEIERDGRGMDVLQALKYAVAQKDPMGFINSPVKSAQASESFAWRMFNSVMTLLQDFEALEGTTATNLGQMVGSLTGDNELWLALVLQKPSVIALGPGELAAIMCGVITDGFKASNAYFRMRPSDRVRAVMEELEQEGMELKLAQTEMGIDFPVNLCKEAGGLIEQWATGISWRELCKETSLDQGDICRMLRRTVEVLRQIPLTYGISPQVAQTAYAAAVMMDRFPVADFDPNVDSKERSGVGYGDTGEESAPGVDDFDEKMLYEEDEGEDEDEDDRERVGDGLKVLSTSLLDELDAGLIDYNLDDLLDELNLS
jgi:superfamily II RNA helicase